MSLVERLHYKTLQELYDNMSNNDIMEWLAYDKCNNPETRALLEREVTLEMQKGQTAQQEADRILNLFKALG